jgi:predicted N-acetyltransferase YhbS
MIRDASPADYEAINRLGPEAYVEFEVVIGAVHWERMRASLANATQFANTAELIVAERVGVLAGFVAYFPPGKSDGVIFPQAWSSVRMLSVAPMHRGQGIGRVLMEECISRA